MRNSLQLYTYCTMCIRGVHIRSLSFLHDINLEKVNMLLIYIPTVLYISYLTSNPTRSR